MTRIERSIAIAAVLLLGSAGPVRAEDAPTSDADRIEQLERRVGELEQAETERDAAPAAAWLPEWTQRVRVGGSASVGYFHRGDVSPEDSDGFQVWDARLFVDAELADRVELGGATAIRAIGATFEWDLVRIGDLQNQVGELYADFQGLGDSSWWNAQVGRFQIPVGEGYLRYSKGYRDNPFISNAIGAPWWWDEGVKLYGHDEANLFGYVASVSNGETDFNFDSNTDPQATLKLYTDPWPWLHLSVSGLVSGEIGRSDEASSGALWFGETWAIPIGHWTDVPTFVDGAAVADAPNQIDHTWFLGADAVVKPIEGLRLWLAGGTYRMATEGSLYDRDLHYWLAEIVAEGSLVSPALQPVYLALRANGLTTADSERGYLLHMNLSETAGYNLRDLNEYSTALGVRIGKYVVLRGEYAYQDLTLVRGVSPAIHSAVDDVQWFGFDVGVSF